VVLDNLMVLDNCVVLDNRVVLDNLVLLDYLVLLVDEARQASLRERATPTLMSFRSIMRDLDLTDPASLLPLRGCHGGMQPLG
jgi:hypothetical protein